MFDNVCQSLTDHLETKKSAGLVDIKFYVHRTSGLSPEAVCEEAASLFNAIASGYSEPFQFGDAPMTVAS